MRRPAFTPKLLASAAVVGAAASIAGLGTYATWTSSTPAQNQTVSAGTVQIALGSTNRLTTNATGLVPGDVVERAVDLNGPASGVTGIGSISLGVTVGASTLLDSDTTNGLHINVDSCPSAWTESGTAPAYTYSCSGSVTSLVSNQPVIGNFNLPSLNSMNVGGVDHLRVKLTLPASAPTTMMGLSDTLSYVFTATARAGGNR
jgi:predicted ribosomally synthesized peptide with SipW-like signal peptide